MLEYFCKDTNKCEIRKIIWNFIFKLTICRLLLRCAALARFWQKVG